jgi:hypothetical protein
MPALVKSAFSSFRSLTPVRVEVMGRERQAMQDGPSAVK